MLPPSLAIAWLLWRRHQGAVVLMLGYLGVAAVLSPVLAGMPLAPWAAKALFGAATFPGCYVAMGLVGIFSFGFEGEDLIARESCFPASLFTLPVRTGTLAGWHLAYGTAAVALAWVFFAFCILRPWVGPWGMMVPLWWPAMFMAAGLAWVQALLWLPFGLPGVRILLATVVGVGFAFGAGYSVHAGVSEGKLVAISTGVAAVAWGCAYVAVRRARRGEVPNWQGLFRPLARPAAWLPRSRRSFASAAWAQVWFEWRRTGKSLPIMTGLVLPVALFPLFLAKNDVIPTATTLLGVLVIPVFLSGIAGIKGSRDRSSSRDEHVLAPFTATLPMSTAGMVGARFMASALSVLAATMLVALVLPLALVLSGRLEDVTGWWQQALQAHRAIDIVAALVAAAMLLPLWTWKRQVDASLLVLTGRLWAQVVSMIAFLAGGIALACVGGWIYHHPASHERLLALLPWALGGLLLTRVVMTRFVLRLAVRRGLLATRTAARWAVGELALAAVVLGLLALSMPADPWLWYYLACAVFWCLPMAHLAAAPLALAWNRHR